ncbi:MAG: hypothetical protein JXX14_10165 [Deltaproteobacteria bacterium]|nr:hypothetical protein [Deltaproteobacteria bacterium]
MTGARTKYIVAGIVGTLIIVIAVTYITTVRRLMVSAGNEETHPLPEAPALPQAPVKSSHSVAAVPAGPATLPPEETDAIETPDTATLLSGPQCVVDGDCRGPKQADCVSSKCVENTCQYNHSACECTGNDQCDDNIPCTRDLCFSSTMKCIHIEDACR